MIALLWLQGATPFTVTLRQKARGQRTKPWRATSAVVVFAASGLSEVVSDDGTVRILKDGRTGQKLTLIGTAHMSKKSNEQVRDVIETTRPDVVMVELDESRLPRIGFQSTADLGKPFGTVDGIIYPPQPDDLEADANRPWFAPVLNLLLDAFTAVARMTLTDSYNDMGETLDLKGGGEFLEAINAAKKDPVCQRIILGDRDSRVTIKRAAELALRSGDPMGVLNRLMSVSQAEMSIVEAKVRSEMESSSESELDEKELKQAVIESIKTNASFQANLFQRIETEVPEFSRAFITERDYIMAEAILREGENGARNIVVVVGAAHLAGMSKNLLETWGERSINSSKRLS
jgi:pheromone shutdown protein TraB